MLLTRTHHPSQGRRRIGAAVNDVTNEHQATPLRMLTALVITQMTQQLLQHRPFAMHIANNVERTTGQILNEMIVLHEVPF